jgi:hypothetical protein
MKNPILLILLCLMSLLLTSCEAIAGIFKAGMSVGAIGVIIVIVLVVGLLIRLLTGKKA